MVEKKVDGVPGSLVGDNSTTQGVSLDRCQNDTIAGNSPHKSSPEHLSEAAFFGITISTCQLVTLVASWICIGLLTALGR